MELSGLLEKLEPGDDIMADKGFQIQDLLALLGVRLNIPPFLSGNTQMPESDVILTKKVAHLRIHVERAIGHVKDFRILKDTLPATMWDLCLLYAVKLQSTSGELKYFITCEINIIYKCTVESK